MLLTVSTPVLTVKIKPSFERNGEVLFPSSDLGHLFVSVAKLFGRLVPSQVEYTSPMVCESPSDADANTENFSFYIEKDIPELSSRLKALFTAYKQRAVLPHGHSELSTELLSTCHLDLKTLMKSGLNCAGDRSDFLAEMPDENFVFPIGEADLNYCRSLAEKKYLGEPVELRLKPEQFLISNNRISAKLRPGLRWRLRQSADLNAKLIRLIEQPETASVNIVGRPELSFGRVTREVELLEVEQFSRAA